MPARTLRLIAGSIFCILFAAFVPRLSAAESNSPEIGVLLRFDTAPGNTFVSAMQRELARIMSRADLRLRWLLPQNSDGKQNFDDAVVFTFHGACRAVPDPQTDALGETADTERISLADTVAVGPAILPYSEMNCDRLRDFLSGEGPREVGAETRLGLAMARVLAHEMYHVLLQTREHSGRGISRAAHTPSALLSGSLRFSDDEIVRIRARFSRTLAAAAPVAAAQNMSFRPN